MKVSLERRKELRAGAGIVYQNRGGSQELLDLLDDLEQAEAIAAEHDGLMKDWAAALDRAEAAESLVEKLQRQIEGHCARIAAQSELLSKKAEVSVGS